MKTNRRQVPAAFALVSALCVLGAVGCEEASPAGLGSSGADVTEACESLCEDLEGCDFFGGDGCVESCEEATDDCRSCLADSEICGDDCADECADDDGGGETDARVRFTVPEDGLYLLIAQALEEDGGGEFTLVLEPTAAPTTAAARPIRVGQTVSDELAETDAVQEDDDTYYDTWTVDGHAGHLDRIALGAGNVEIGRQVVGGAQALAGGIFEELENFPGGFGKDHVAIGALVEPDGLEMAAAIEEIELLGLGVGPAFLGGTLVGGGQAGLDDAGQFGLRRGDDDAGGVDAGDLDDLLRGDRAGNAEQHHAGKQ